MLIKISFVLLFTGSCFAAELPTLYEYYTKGGIKSGLEANGDKFHLNGKEIQIFAGALHPFRVHQARWKETLLKMKAAGLNAVGFYTSWNLHEETPGHFDFENGTQNLKFFLTLIKEMDMFAVFRPGPYINAERELGGFPSWLLRDPNMRFRINYKPFVEAVDKYWGKLFEVTGEFQFTKHGGPIIMIQIENEYGGNLHKDKNTMEYIRSLINITRKHGMTELLFKSDFNPSEVDLLSDVLESVNTGGDTTNRLTHLKKLQPNKPLYIYELYTGWLDEWKGKHAHHSVQELGQILDESLKLGASFNLYMFIGGTNFGFMASGDKDTAVTTSYDFDAVLSEAGHYTPKYNKTKEILEKYTKDHKLPQIRLPNPPAEEKTAKYGVVKVSEQLPLQELVKHAQGYKVDKPIHPELLNIGPNYGQLYGFTLYRTTIPKSKTLKFSQGQIRDRGQVVIDGKQSNEITHQGKAFDINLDATAFTKSGNDHTLDILMENMGRGRFDLEGQRKGISEDVLIDGKDHKNWEMFALDFKPDFLEKVKKDKWSPFTGYKEPTLFRATFDIKDEPKDTFLKLDGWHLTVVFVNDFNVGKYWDLGPQKTLYIPAPVLKKGENEILLFETWAPGNHIEFVDTPNLG